MTKENHVLFVDTLGRLLIGKLPVTEGKEEGSDIIKIKNPAIIHATHKQEGGLTITVIPIVFREFLADKDEAIVFNYARSSISIADAPILDVRIIGQYENMFAPVKDMINVPQIAPPPANQSVAPKTPPVINIFDKK